MSINKNYVKTDLHTGKQYAPGPIMKDTEGTVVGEVNAFTIIRENFRIFVSEVGAANYTLTLPEYITADNIYDMGGVLRMGTGSAVPLCYYTGANAQFKPLINADGTVTITWGSSYAPKADVPVTGNIWIEYMI